MLLVKQINLADNNAVKTLATNLEKEVGNAVIVFGTISNDKPQLTICISPDLVKSKNLNAGTMIRELAKDIKGGGGGQPTFASAGGVDTEGLVKEMTFKGKQSIFPHHQPLHCLVLTFRSNYEAYCHSISKRNIDLRVDSARITGNRLHSCF